ncbi:MAG: HNH endonuclease signature motif containing protein [Phenylobacterium sp.]
MPNRAIDPASLQGDALTRWYQRSPWEIEQERQAAEARRHDDFFGAIRHADSDPGFGRRSEEPPGNVDPGFSRGFDTPAKDIDPGFNWVAVGPNRWRSERIYVHGHPQGTEDRASFHDGGFLDRRGAGPDDGGEFAEVGNPANRRLRREYERGYGPWPKTEDGRNFHVAHTKAVADGGTNTLDNIRPMHPDEHIAEHMANGDLGRWARRPGIARAFGGSVARGLGPLSILSDITGMLSGRIRADNFDNFTSDMMEWPSQADRRQQLEREQKAIDPNWKPGDPVVI